MIGDVHGRLRVRRRRGSAIGGGRHLARAPTTAEFGVSVLEGYRGHGIGKALIDHLERWAADHGIELMILTVFEANEGAIRLYHAAGLPPTSSR